MAQKLQSDVVSNITCHWHRADQAGGEVLLGEEMLVFDCSTQLLQVFQLLTWSFT